MGKPTIVVVQNGNPVYTGPGPLVVGGRTGVDVVVEDVAIADRHLLVAFDGVFQLRDLGSVTGTWLDGKPVTTNTPIRDGATIVFGTSVLRAKLAAGDDGQQLELELEPRAFWWKKPGKGAFDNDPDAMVRREVSFGRFPVLHTSNRIAIVAATVLAIAAVFVSAVMDPLADPGPLQPSHALVYAAAAGTAAPGDVHAGLDACIAVAKEQGCAACHASVSGVIASKCLQCHGDLAAKETWRHPYLGDGVLGSAPGADEGPAFCVRCHTDHQGNAGYKDGSEALTGDCAACHADGANFDQAALLAKLPPIAVATTTRPFADYRFPHDVHVGKEIACTICHRADDDVRTRALAGLPDDPRRQDFVDVPYETCASCHVPGSPPHHMTAAEQQKGRASAEHQWPVAWHGTDDAASHCKACHAEAQRDGRTVVGPEFKLVQRPLFTAEQYAAERARYTSPARLHTEQFAAHAEGRECTSCHVTGSVRADEPRPVRTFWHALHAADGALQPATGRGGAISTDPVAGCLSCHGDLRTSKALQPASAGSYHWPGDAVAQEPCGKCHRDGDRTLPLTAAKTMLADERLAKTPTIDFPHDVHVQSALFGAAGGKLAEGCFACHAFAEPDGGGAFRAVPRTLPAALDCRTCHAGHAHVGGNSCQQCHPADAASSNSFLLAAAVPPGTLLPGRAAPVPERPSRSWPRNDTFNHWSPGHRGPDLACTTCHDTKSFATAKTIGTTPVPDDAHPSCRECHLKKQFHWR